MNADTTYNGWTNYPTWCVNLWLDNDGSLNEERNERVAQITSETESRSEHWTLQQSHQYSTEDMLKEWVAELVAEEYDRPTMLADLIGYALGEVNWRELAEHYVYDSSEVQA